MPPRLQRPVHWFLLALLAWSWSCNLDNPGDPPPRATIYFPTAVQVSPGTTPKYLYVLNSNYDYLFGSGSLQAYNLDYIDGVLAKCDVNRLCHEACINDLQTCNGECGDAHPCPEKCMGDAACEEQCDVRAECLDACGSRVACEDTCNWDGGCDIDAVEALEDEVLVPTHGTAMAQTVAGDRLYAASRTVRKLTFVDVDPNASGDDVLDCGPKRTCDGYHQRGVDNTESQRRTEMPADPVGVITGARSELVLPDEPADVKGNYVMVAHREGAVSLFLEEDGTTKDGKSQPPELVHVRSGLLSDITHIAYDESSHYIYLTNRQTNGGVDQYKELTRISVVWDDDARNSFAYAAGRLILDGVSLGRETRALQFVAPNDPAAGRASGHALVVSRVPPALLTVDVADSEVNPGHATVTRTTEVGNGPSRLMLGTVDGVALAFVSTFNSRQVYLIDTDSGLIRSVVPNLSGPFEIALDPGRHRLYVADFSSSVVRVISIANFANRMGDGPTTARLEGTLGVPRVVQELQ